MNMEDLVYNEPKLEGKINIMANLYSFMERLDSCCVKIQFVVGLVGRITNYLYRIRTE